MIVAIESLRRLAYVSGMRTIAATLALLLALLFMPFGMAAAPAATHPGSHPAAHAAMPVEHCPDGQSKGAMKGGFAECTMACAAALPAADMPRADGPLIICTPEPQLSVERLDGLHPDPATPPPKRS